MSRKAVSWRVDTDLIEALDQMAKRLGLSRSEIARRSMIRGLALIQKDLEETSTASMLEKTKRLNK